MTQYNTIGTDGGDKSASHDVTSTVNIRNIIENESDYHQEKRAIILQTLNCLSMLVMWPHNRFNLGIFLSLFVCLFLSYTILYIYFNYLIQPQGTVNLCLLSLT